MKVLMINSVCGYGSTGSICTDIAGELEKRGHECYIAYGQGTTTYPKTFKIGSVIENHLHNIQSRVFGNQGYYSRSGTTMLISYIEKIQPDVIHLHNLHGNYLHLGVLFDFLTNYGGKVVWTLHDCWAFTGKCAHYTDVACYRWKTHCHHCPQLKTYPPSLFFDRSSKMFDDKIKWFNAVKNLTVIPVSNWLAEEVAQSFLRNHTLETIYNWVDSAVFKPYDKLKFVNDYGLDTNKFTIIVVSAAWSINTVRWRDLLALADRLGDSYQLAVVGQNSHKHLLSSNCIPIDYVDGKDKLAPLYSFADVYVHLSTEDTFGKVIAESLSCGTPAVVYDSTACPEIVGDGCGYVVEKRNIQHIVAAIHKIKKHTKAYYSDKCTDWANSQFNLHTNINRIINVYNNPLQ